jgi:hypothetical protein
MVSPVFPARRGTPGEQAHTKQEGRQAEQKRVAPDAHEGCAGVHESLLHLGCTLF